MHPRQSIACHADKRKEKQNKKGEKIRQLTDGTLEAYLLFSSLSKRLFGQERERKSYCSASFVLAPHGRGCHAITNRKERERERVVGWLGGEAKW